MAELQELFNSIICLAVEGPEVMRSSEVLASIERDAKKGLEIAKQQPEIDELKSLTRKLKACWGGWATIQMRFWAHETEYGVEKVNYWVTGKNFGGEFLNSWSEVQQAVEWFVACSYAPQNVSVYASGTE